MAYFFHPAAEAEYLETVAYYESKRAGLGASYLAEFEGMMVAVGRRSRCEGGIHRLSPGVKIAGISRAPWRIRMIVISSGHATKKIT